jgi:uncharacterized repeat protein (TIGR03803 family)
MRRDANGEKMTVINESKWKATPGEVAARRGRAIAKAARLVIAVAALLIFAGLPLQAQTESVLYSFAGGATSGPDGATPASALLRDDSGNLYGTTEAGGATGNGTVFELVNNPPGTYTPKVLYNFKGSAASDGAVPFAGLVMDSNGDLFGTTSIGGSSNVGTVFELVNNPPGTYTPKVLHSFTGTNGDGAGPYSTLVMDSSGDLFGTTLEGGDSGFGTVFEMMNNAGNYTKIALYSFQAGILDGGLPYSGLVADSAGNLYGTASLGGASNAGTIFEMVFSAPGSYSEIILYSFTGFNGDGRAPQTSLTIDSLNNLYGTTLFGGTSTACGTKLGCGTAFELAYSSTSQSYVTPPTILHTFTGGSDGGSPSSLIIDSSGNLYGTTQIGGGSAVCAPGCGTVFELLYSPAGYTEKSPLLNSFPSSSDDGLVPDAGLVLDSSGNLYGTTTGGGVPTTACGNGTTSQGCGTVFEVTAGSAGQTYTLTTMVVGPGTIQQSPAGTSFDPGTSITLTAVPNANSTFTSWSGACEGSTNPDCMFSIDANTSVTATFAGNVQAPPQIVKAFGLAIIPLNGITSLTFSISNPNSGSSLSGISFTDNFPAGLAIAATSNLTNNGCGGTVAGAPGASLVSLTGGTLAGGASCTISLNVTGTSEGTINNSVSVTSTQTGAGNTSIASLVVQAGLFSPTSGTQGENLNVTFTGSGFVQGVTRVSFAVQRIGSSKLPTPGITVKSVTVLDSGDLVANIIISQKAKVGPASVTVETGTQKINYGTFVILAGALVVSPNVGTQGETLDVTLTGFNFFVGSTTVTFGNGNSGIAVNNVTVPDSTEAIANITIASNARTTERYSVTVSNGKSSFTQGDAFTVELGMLTLSPNFATQGDTLDVTLTGFTFVSGATTVKFGNNASEITVNSVTVPDPSEAIANITISPKALTTRPYNVTVNIGQSTIMQGDAFTVKPGSLTLEPNTGTQGDTLNVTLTGLTFTSDTTVTFGTNSLGSGITVNKVTVPNSGEAIANITIASNARTTQPLSVTVNNGHSFTQAGAFTVEPASLTLSPTSGTQGETFNLTLTGLPFVSGMTTVQIGSITANTVTVDDTVVPEAIANFTLPLNATLGKYAVTVTIFGSQPITFTQPRAFQVNQAAATLSPDTGEQGQTLNVVFSGLPFMSGTPSVTFNSTGIEVNSFTAIDANDAVANITIAFNARPEKVKVNVTIAGSSTITLNGVAEFTVVAP